MGDGHVRVLAAPEDGDGEIEKAFPGAWRLHLRDPVRRDPAAALEPKHVLDRELLPVLDAAGRAAARLVNSTAGQSKTRLAEQFGRLSAEGGRTVGPAGPHYQRSRPEPPCAPRATTMPPKSYEI